MVTDLPTAIEKGAGSVAAFLRSAPPAVQTTGSAFLKALAAWIVAIANEGIVIEAKKEAGPFAGLVEHPIETAVDSVIDQVATDATDLTPPAPEAPL